MALNKLQAWVLANSSSRKRSQFSIRDRVRRGDLPLAVQRITGLWAIFDSEGWFVLDKDGQHLAAIKSKNGLVALARFKPASPEDAAAAVERHAEELEMFEEQNSIPF